MQVKETAGIDDSVRAAMSNATSNMQVLNSLAKVDKKLVLVQK